MIILFIQQCIQVIYKHKLLDDFLKFLLNNFWSIILYQYIR